MEFLYTALIIFVIVGASFILINLRNVVTGKEFRGTCSTNNPMLKNEIGECTVCGKSADETECQLPEPGKAS